MSHFNPFYYFYTQEQSSQALETQISAKKKRKEKLFFPLLRLPKLATVHEKLTKITSSVPVIKLIEIVLKRAGEANSTYPLVTPKHVHYVCLLVIQGYQDDIVANETEFADRAETIQVVRLLQDVANNYKDFEIQDVVAYTMERVNDSRELILNLDSKNTSSSGSSSQTKEVVGGGKGDSDEEMARKRRAAAAASRRYNS